MTRKIALITASPPLALPFVRDVALHRRLDIEIALAIRIHPSMKLADRARDLRRTIVRRSKINGTSVVAQSIHYLVNRQFMRTRNPRPTMAAAIDALREGRRFVAATSVNEPAVAAALQAQELALGVVIGGDVFSRRTLDALDLPLFNLHLSDPAFVRGLPPIFWEVLDGRDSIVLTMHRLTSTLDGGDVIHQRAVPIVWQPTLGATLRATRATFDQAIPALLEQGLRQILEGAARPRPIVPGPLRTLPSTGQLLEARRKCRKRWRESHAKAR